MFTGVKVSHLATLILLWQIQPHACKLNGRQNQLCVHAHTLYEGMFLIRMCKLRSCHSNEIRENTFIAWLIAACRSCTAMKVYSLHGNVSNQLERLATTKRDW